MKYQRVFIMRKNAPVRRIRSDNRRRVAIDLLLCVLLSAVPAIIAGCTKGLDKTTQVAGQGGVAGFTAGGQTSPAAPGSLPSTREEIWVVAQTRSISNPSGDQPPTTGAMCIQVENELIPMPLKHTDVKADIAGHIASVKVRQEFRNHHSSRIEAVYVFPLPENAAVNEFVMTIGERRIRGIIRERAEAEKIYREAKQQGYVASLLTQERPNVFTQAVANIEPGKAIEVTIQYFHTLAYDDGWYEFVFPMVVGPRFNPAGITDGIGATSRAKRGESGQKTEISYLAPKERGGHDISLQVDIDAGVSIEETSCTSHKTVETRNGPHQRTMVLSPEDSIPNKDFVLRYRVAGERIKSTLLTHEDSRGGFFTLMLYPPSDLKTLTRQSLELVFVLDCSGSMSGEPIAQAKAAIRRALERLQPGDSFQIIRFSDNSSALGSKPMTATAENIARGQQYLHGLQGEGGTMMVEGVKAALDFPHDPERLRFVCFLTDGYIGNEIDILAAVQQRLGASRIFSFGVGAAPNRFLMDRMAHLGRGAVAYLGSKDDPKTVMDAFLDRISHPALADVQVDWGGLKVRDVLPQRVPDLFVGRPVILTGRFEGRPGKIHASGLAAGQKVSLEVEAADSTKPGDHPALASVWARMKVAELSRRALEGNTLEIETAIRRVALDFNLMSDYTAFVAVDALTRTTGDPAVTVPVATPVPPAVNHEKTVKK